MTSPWYNPNPLEPNTRATAEQVNAELAKIAAAFGQLPAPSAIGTGAGTPNYTHYAYADSADGTANFTTGAAANRSYIGVSTNRSNPTPSPFPEDYSWSRLKGADGTDGTDGTDGDNGQDGLDGGYRDFRFTRSLAQPATATGDSPAGSFDFIPTGTDPVWVTSAFRNGEGVRTSPWEPWVRLSPLPSAQQYNAATTYYEGMQALFNGGTYILIVPSAVGIAPSGTSQANSTWDVVAAPGQQGEPATPPSGFSATIDLTNATTGLNLRTIADAAGFTGLSDATITFRVPNGVVITGSQMGGIGIDSGTWPSGYTIALTLVVQAGGTVYGGGGFGGQGGQSGAGFAGGAGGDAIFLRVAMSGGITVDSGGVVKAGGGGGGGGGASYRVLGGGIYGGAGGGGGGGAPNGAGGQGDFTEVENNPSDPGGNGTTSGGGAGGLGAFDATAQGRDGGNGGTFGVAGTAGTGTNGGAAGPAGYAIRKNGNTATVTNNGTVTGTVS